MGQQHLPGTLEISETGLKVNYIRELHKGVQEIFNPFPTIAVWAAVKFVHKKEANKQGGQFAMTARKVGQMGFAALQCSWQCYFRFILAVKITYFWARPIKITYPQSNLFNRRCQKIAFLIMSEPELGTVRKNMLAVNFCGELFLLGPNH